MTLVVLTSENIYKNICQLPKSQRTLNLGLVFCYKAYHFGSFASRIAQTILAFFGKNCGIVHILPLVALYYKKTARNKLRLLALEKVNRDGISSPFFVVFGGQ